MLREQLEQLTQLLKEQFGQLFYNGLFPSQIAQESWRSMLVRGLLLADDRAGSRIITYRTP